MTFTVESLPSKNELAIFCDAKGLDTLVGQLKILQKLQGHVHLMTPSWGGQELTENKQGAENLLIHHLRVTLVP